MVWLTSELRWTKKRVRGGGGGGGVQSFLWKSFLFSRGIETGDPPQLTVHAVIKDGFLKFLIIDNSPYFLFMN